ncbi:hypothetical protein T07_6873 [Trichinella nelsoni]|uniref:Uncharacterized protein n=1 Tax=Trichinella nelsoni TaxID=6336 RepID=A0A0V0RVX6_9BILA|nr:hypothetical protein T07_6873 [Trichinella nelsoni]
MLGIRMKLVSVMRTVFMFGMATMKFSLKQVLLIFLIQLTFYSQFNEIITALFGYVNVRHKSKRKITKPTAETWNGEKIL